MLKYLLHQQAILQKNLFSSASYTFSSGKLGNPSLPTGDYLFSVIAEQKIAIRFCSNVTQNVFFLLGHPSIECRFYLTLDHGWNTPEITIIPADNSPTRNLRIIATRLPFNTPTAKWGASYFPNSTVNPLFNIDERFGNDWYQYWEKTYASYLLNLDEKLKHFLLINTKQAAQNSTKPVLNVDPNSKDLLVCIHLFYEKMWPEIQEYLSNIKRPFQIWITTPTPKSKLILEIQKQFPGILITKAVNHGYDTLPFFQGIKTGIARSFKLALKIHTKGNHQDGIPTPFGALWRLESFRHLLGNTPHIEHIWRRFEQNPRIGLIGPEIFNLPSERFPVAKCIENIDESINLVWPEQLGKWQDYLTFHAGSMFWFRPSAFDDIHSLSINKLTEQQFNCSHDGVGHILERLIPTVAAANGWIIEDCNINRSMNEPKP